MALRWFAAVMAALLLEGLVLHFMGITVDRIVPPIAAYQRATAQTTGYVTGKFKIDNSAMFWNNSDQWAVQYKFQPDVLQKDAKGAEKPVASTTYYNNSVMVDQGSFKGTENGEAITVKYDPDNPLINSVPGTVGVMSRSCGWLGIWLL